ncbi:MAG: hypothetical protein IJM59_14290 [Proteobacteria bacterium]|nr:hypothetical protein [Pseudomonadota bacterium]
MMYDDYFDDWLTEQELFVREADKLGRTKEHHYVCRLIGTVSTQYRVYGDIQEVCAFIEECERYYSHSEDICEITIYCLDTGRIVGRDEAFRL